MPKQTAVIRKNGKGVHALCARCANPCKDPITSNMLICERFEPAMSNEEFDQLLVHMEVIIGQTAQLHKRTASFLNTINSETSPVLAPPVPADPTEES